MDIVKYQYHRQRNASETLSTDLGPNGSCSQQPRRCTMNATPELLTTMQRDRERTTELDRMACQASCAGACCAPTLLDRVARALRGSAGHLLRENR